MPLKGSEEASQAIREQRTAMSLSLVNVIEDASRAVLIFRRVDGP